MRRGSIVTTSSSLVSLHQVFLDWFPFNLPPSSSSLPINVPLSLCSQTAAAALFVLEGFFFFSSSSSSLCDCSHLWNTKASQQLSSAGALALTARRRGWWRFLLLCVLCRINREVCVCKCECVCVCVLHALLLLQVFQFSGLYVCLLIVYKEDEWTLASADDITHAVSSHHVDAVNLKSKAAVKAEVL